MIKIVLPRAGSALLLWSQNFAECLKANVKILNLDSVKVTEIQSLISKFRTELDKSRAVNRTKADVQRKNAVSIELKAAIRKFVSLYLEYNQGMTLELYYLLGFAPVKSARSKPVFLINKPRLEGKSNEGQIIIRYIDNENGKIGKPKGVKVIMYRWDLLDKDPEIPEMLSNAETLTSGSLVLNFNENQRGKPFYYSARWVNGLGKPGPWSDIKKIFIA